VLHALQRLLRDRRSGSKHAMRPISAVVLLEPTWRKLCALAHLAETLRNKFYTVYGYFVARAWFPLTHIDSPQTCFVRKTCLPKSIAMLSFLSVQLVQEGHPHPARGPRGLCGPLVRKHQPLRPACKATEYHAQGHAIGEEN
jgi:hypothetical protein